MVALEVVHVQHRYERNTNTRRANIRIICALLIQYISTDDIVYNSFDNCDA